MEISLVGAITSIPLLPSPFRKTVLKPTARRTKNKRAFAGMWKLKVTTL
jgi:hypothetical protein